MKIAFCISGETREHNKFYGPDSMITYLMELGHTVDVFGHTWDHSEVPNSSLYNFKLSGLISGKDESYISLTNTSGDVITLNLNQYLGKIKFIDLRLTEAIFEKEDKSFIIIDFNNQIREADEY